MARPVRLRRTLKLISSDGIACSVMVGAGECYLPAFALAVGLSDVAAGLVATLPMVAGGMLQMLTPRGVALLGGYRAWVATCAAVQALSFAPLVAAALSRAIPPQIVFASATLYWAAGMASGPAWSSWVSQLVPSGLRGRYFGLRQSMFQVGLLAGLLGAGLFLESRGDDLATAFALIFAIACAARLVSAAVLAAHPDAVADNPLGALDCLRRARSSPEWTWMLLVVGTHGAANIAGPYFTPFLLTEIKLSYAGYTALISAVFVGKAVALPLLGRGASGSSALRMMAAGTVGITSAPLLWLASDNLIYLLVVQLYAGASWAAFELAAQLGFLAVTSGAERASLLHTFNALNSASVALASLAGGLLLYALGSDRTAYAAVFIVSFVARLIAASLLADRLRGQRIPYLIPLRILSVRPWSGAVLRPIWAARKRISGTRRS